MGDKMTEAELNEYVSTFEETLQRFTGLSSEEIWELQRILLRRVRFKVSETLSPEGKTAMNQVKQDMLELAKKKRVSSATLVSELFDLGSKQTEEPPREEAKAVIVLVEMPADGPNKPTDDKAAVDTTDSIVVEKMIIEQTEGELNAKGIENTLTGAGASVKETDENVKRDKDNINQIADSESQTNDALADSVRGGVGSSDTGPHHEDPQPDSADSVKDGVGSAHHEDLQPDNVIGDKVGDTEDTRSGEPQASKRNGVASPGDVASSPGDVASSSNVDSEHNEGEGQERRISQDRIKEQSSQMAETPVESETPSSLPS